MISQAARSSLGLLNRRIIASNNHEFKLHFVVYVGTNPNEPSVVHLLEDYESSSESPRDVNVVGNTETSASAAARTPAQ